MQAPPEDYPVTGLCVVADPSKCPPGYEALLRSYDKKDDCDLWKDSLFKSKVTRYLCFTRIFPLDGGRLNNVLADIVINNERDLPPTGFTLLDFTHDTREKATRKKQLCVKMVGRGSAGNAICDVIILSRSKRPPSGYTLAGEMNGLLVCFKMGIVPAGETSGESPLIQPMEAPQQPQTAYPVQPYSYNNGGTPNSSPYIAPSPKTTPAKTSNPSLMKQDTLHMPSSVLSGVPFQLNPRFQDLDTLKAALVPQIHYRSVVDLESEYNYPFRVEETAAARIPPDLLG